MQVTNVARPLGELSYCGFQTRKLKNPLLVYRSQELADRDGRELLDAYGWMIPGVADAQACEAVEKRFYAERYGGGGIGSHGGGVRCGTDFQLSIKGLGCNPLCGRNAPPEYAHGGMSLFECVQEAIWGAVFDIALPFGASKVLAIIGTDTPCWWVTSRWSDAELSSRYGSPPSLPRGMIVRDAPLRPAHFMRAPFHVPQDGRKDFATMDLARVCQATDRLLGLMPSPSHIRTRSEDAFEGEAIERGLSELAARLAVQSAAAKAKRLVHGNITASNVCLDGKWIDYGSATALPGWGAISGYGPFWEDRDLYAAIFDDLAHAISKGLGKRFDRSYLCSMMQSVYSEAHMEEMHRRQLCLAGFPYSQTGKISATPEGRRVARFIRDQLVDGYSRPMSAHPDEHCRLGGLQLGSKVDALLQSAFCRSVATTDCSELASDVISLAKMTEKKVDHSSENLTMQAMLLRARKCARPTPFLYRDAMVKESERIVLAAADVRDLGCQVNAMISSAIDEASLLLSDADNSEFVGIYQDRGELIGWFTDTGTMHEVVSFGAWGQFARGKEVVGASLDKVNRYWGKDLVGICGGDQ